MTLLSSQLNWLSTIVSLTETLRLKIVNYHCKFRKEETGSLSENVHPKVKLPKVCVLGGGGDGQSGGPFLACK